MVLCILLSNDKSGICSVNLRVTLPFFDKKKKRSKAVITAS